MIMPRQAKWMPPGHEACRSTSCPRRRTVNRDRPARRADSRPRQPVPWTRCFDRAQENSRDERAHRRRYRSATHLRQDAPPQVRRQRSEFRGTPSIWCLLPPRSDGAHDVGLLEDAYRPGVAGTMRPIDAASLLRDAEPRGRTTGFRNALESPRRRRRRRAGRLPASRETP